MKSLDDALPRLLSETKASRVTITVSLVAGKPQWSLRVEGGAAPCPSCAAGTFEETLRKYQDIVAANAEASAAAASLVRELLG